MPIQIPLYHDNAAISGVQPVQQPLNQGVGAGMQALGKSVESVGAVFANLFAAADKQLTASQRVTDISDVYNGSVLKMIEASESLQKEHAEDAAGYRTALFKRWQEIKEEGTAELKLKKADKLTLNGYETQINNHTTQQYPQVFTDSAKMQVDRATTVRKTRIDEFVNRAVDMDERTLTDGFADLAQTTYGPDIKAKHLTVEQATLELHGVEQKVRMERAYKLMRTNPELAHAQLMMGSLMSGEVVKATGGDKIHNGLGRPFLPSEVEKIHDAMTKDMTKTTEAYWKDEGNARVIAHTQGNYSTQQHYADKEFFKSQPDVWEHIGSRMSAYDASLRQGIMDNMTLDEKIKGQQADIYEKLLTNSLLSKTNLNTDPEANEALKKFVAIGKPEAVRAMLKAADNQFRYGVGDEAWKDHWKLAVSVNPDALTEVGIFNLAGLTEPQRQEILDEKKKSTEQGKHWMPEYGNFLEGEITKAVGADTMGMGAAEINHRVSAGRVAFRHRLMELKEAGTLTNDTMFAAFGHVVTNNPHSNGAPYAIPEAYLKKYPIGDAGARAFMENEKDKLPYMTYETILLGYLYQSQAAEQLQVSIDKADPNRYKKVQEKQQDLIKAYNKSEGR